MKKALIVTWEKYQDHEVIYPYYRVLEEGFEVDIMSNVKGKIFGILGTYMESTRTVDELNDTDSYNNIMDEYDLLILPGGVKSLEKLRQEQQRDKRRRMFLLRQGRFKAHGAPSDTFDSMVYPDFFEIGYL